MRLKAIGQGLAVATVIALLGLLVWKIAFADQGGAAAKLAQGEHPVAPGFTLPRLDADSTLSLASLRGKAVVVNFWASWCEPCKDEAPMLQAAYERYRSHGLVVLGVDLEDFRSDARAFMRRYGVTYPVVHAKDKEALVGRYGVTGYPETFFVDRSGRLVGERIAGAINLRDNPERFATGIQAALETTPPVR
jgi:cytochrome c biogenesis protein CcmG, thiol:disulfide interchange protein DsbE